MRKEANVQLAYINACMGSEYRINVATQETPSLELRVLTMFVDNIGCTVYTSKQVAIYQITHELTTQGSRSPRVSLLMKKNIHPSKHV